MANSRNWESNRNSRIVSRIDRTGKVRTETTNRDGGTLDIAVSTDTRTNTTRVFFDAEGREGNFGGRADLSLTGSEARTLYRTLQRHFEATGKSTR